MQLRSRKRTLKRNIPIRTKTTGSKSSRVLIRSLFKTGADQPKEVVVTLIVTLTKVKEK